MFHCDQPCLSLFVSSLSVSYHNVLIIFLLPVSYARIDLHSAWTHLRDAQAEKKTLHWVTAAWRTLKKQPQHRRTSHHSHSAGTSRTHTGHNSLQLRRRPPWIFVSRLSLLFSYFSRLHPALHPDSVCKMHARMCGAALWSSITLPERRQCR